MLKIKPTTPRNGSVRPFWPGNGLPTRARCRSHSSPRGSPARVREGSDGGIASATVQRAASARISWSGDGRRGQPRGEKPRLYRNLHFSGGLFSLRVAPWPTITTKKPHVEVRRRSPSRSGRISSQRNIESGGKLARASSSPECPHCPCDGQRLLSASLHRHDRKVMVDYPATTDLRVAGRDDENNSGEAEALCRDGLPA